LLRELLIECGAVKFGKFTLASGRESSYYVDIKKASTNPKILSVIAKDMARAMKNARYDRIAGMELGAVPIAVALSLETGVAYVIVRKGERTHGTGKQIEGDFKAGDKCLVVEDVTTTGQSSLKTVEILKNAGIETDTVLTVVDREEGAGGLLSKSGIKLDALVRAGELIKK
jgi:orotate phosphoribosyltransferase